MGRTNRLLFWFVAGCVAQCPGHSGRGTHSTYQQIARLLDLAPMSRDSPRKQENTMVPFALSLKHQTLMKRSVSLWMLRRECVAEIALRTFVQFITCACSGEGGLQVERTQCDVRRRDVDALGQEQMKCLVDGFAQHVLCCIAQATRESGCLIECSSMRSRRHLPCVSRLRVVGS